MGAAAVKIEAGVVGGGGGGGVADARGSCGLITVPDCFGGGIGLRLVGVMNSMPSKAGVGGRRNGVLGKCVDLFVGCWKRERRRCGPVDAEVSGTPWRNGSASDSRSEGCVFKSRRGQVGFLCIATNRVTLLCVCDDASVGASYLSYPHVVVVGRFVHGKVSGFLRWKKMRVDWVRKKWVCGAPGEARTLDLRIISTAL